MVGKPLITIKNFTGISNKGVYWLEGFRPRYYNGESVLATGWTGQFKLSNATTLFTGIATGITSFAKISYSSDERTVFMAGAKLYGYTEFDKTGLMHTIVSGIGTGTDYIYAGGYTSMLSSKKQNLLYTSTNHIGLGIVGTCNSSSSTTKIVDQDGRNFTALGLSTAAGRNKVFNVDTKTEFTITSISTTTATNDTLNFSAGTANADGNMFIAFVDDKFKFGTTGVGADQQFTGQTQNTFFRRSSLAWNSAFYFLNGNYISKLSDDDTAWTSDILDEFHKQLPTSTQAMDFAMNGDKMLVAGDAQNTGVLLLWDGYASGWINRIELGSTPQCVQPYGSGFIYVVDGNCFYTDGYSTTLLFSIPDSQEATAIPLTNHGIAVWQDNIFMLGGYSTQGGGRNKTGLWTWNKDSGLVWSSLDGGGGKRYLEINQSGVLFASKYNSSGSWGGSANRHELACGFSVSNDSSQSYIINKIYPVSSPRNRVILYLPLPHKMKINAVELNINPPLESSQNTSRATEIKARVSYGQNKKLFNQYFFTAASSTTTLIKNAYGASSKSYVGQKIESLQGPLSGQVSYITAIANQGTATEELTISPALSEAPATSATFLKYDLKFAGEKTFTAEEIPDELLFNIPGFYSDQLMLEVELTSSTGFYCEISGINIY